jgi:hypothetical protein
VYATTQRHQLYYNCTYCFGNWPVFKKRKNWVGYWFGIRIAAKWINKKIAAATAASLFSSSFTLFVASPNLPLGAFHYNRGY